MDIFYVPLCRMTLLCFSRKRNVELATKIEIERELDRCLVLCRSSSERKDGEGSRTKERKVHNLLGGSGSGAPRRMRIVVDGNSVREGRNEK